MFHYICLTKAKVLHLPCTSYVYVGETHTSVNSPTSWPHPATYLVSVNSSTYPELTYIPCTCVGELTHNILNSPTYLVSVNSPYPELTYIPCISEGVGLSFMTQCHTCYVHVGETHPAELHAPRCTIQETTSTATHQGRWWADQKKHWLWFTFWNHISSHTTRVHG